MEQILLVLGVWWIGLMWFILTLSGGKRRLNDGPPANIDEMIKE